MLAKIKCKRSRVYLDHVSRSISHLLPVKPVTNWSPKTSSDEIYQDIV